MILYLVILQQGIQGVLSIEIHIPKDSPYEVMGCQAHLANILIYASSISLKQYG